MSALPASVKGGFAGAAKSDNVAASYHWRPIQVPQHEQKHDFTYTLGTCVRTLTMSVGSKTFEGASVHRLRLEPGTFKKQETPWCYLVGGSFVICSGVIVGCCPKTHDPENGKNILIAYLPAHMRPRRPLQFAALMREPYDVGGHLTYSSHLITLMVTPDGALTGVSSQERTGAIDLSAVRFAMDGGISLVDEVSVHTVDVAGSRLVSLQGALKETAFLTHPKKAFALLPESCRPPQDLCFVTTGSAQGGFHLLEAKPQRKQGGVGGGLWWRDSVWNKDQIHLTGTMFEVATDALPYSTLDSSWNPESLKVFVTDFQNFLIRKFGSVEAAWNQAFDLDGSGSVNFTEFGLGCKTTGYVGNATRLWAALDDDRSGEISLQELQMGLEEGEREDDD